MGHRISRHRRRRRSWTRPWPCAFVAAHTRTIRLGTGIIILPQRNPLVLAKGLASVDVVSNGRLMFGIGIGYLKPEFDALGIPFTQKGARAIEYLDAILAMWTQPKPAYSGRFVKFAGIQANPRPVQRPHPPIVMGGGTPEAFRRSVTHANGWYGFALDLPTTARFIEGLQTATFIRERAQGSLQRLQSMPVPGWVLLGGKIAPYLVINQIQLVLILAVGVYGLPLLGGDRLTLGHAPAGIALLGVSASLAAIGFALVIATLARTPEQATTAAATVILILAAIGGIMVPKLVMPPVMQQLAELSPFSWGLEGFLDLFVRGGGVREMLPEAGQLLAFAVVCFVIALLRFGRDWRHD